IAEEGKLGDWEEDWEDPARTPMMVRLSLEFENGTYMRWPVLEVPLLIDVGGVNNAYRFFGPDDGDGQLSDDGQAMMSGQPTPGGVRAPVQGDRNARR